MKKCRKNEVIIINYTIICQFVFQLVETKYNLIFSVILLENRRHLQGF